MPSLIGRADIQNGLCSHFVVVAQVHIRKTKHSDENDVGITLQYAYAQVHKDRRFQFDQASHEINTEQPLSLRSSGVSIL